MPEILKNNGIHSHLVSDHYHYWEDGGATYHTRYRSWQYSRGQEGDPWIGDLRKPSIPSPNPDARDRWPVKQDWINRCHIKNEEDWPQAKSFAMGMDYIKMNKDEDNWFLHLETFDPHEPYYVPKKYKKLYDFDFEKLRSDWPPYSPENGREELSEHYKYLNAALISMCDEHLGKIIDLMDEFNMWEDTMLIVNTDHGFLLGEHQWWGKCHMPFYNEIAKTPLFIWDPRSGAKGERRESLVQTIDLAPTLLEYFNLDRPKDMQGKPLKETIENDSPVREAGLFGIYSGHINCTDGRYVHMLAPNPDKPIYEYTHMPTHMKGFFFPEEMRTTEMSAPFEFTKGCPVMKIKGNVFNKARAAEFGSLLFDTLNDPAQNAPLNDSEIEKMMRTHIIREMKANDAPEELFKRMGLN
jgi:hypothetical protein